MYRMAPATENNPAPTSTVLRVGSPDLNPNPTAEGISLYLTVALLAPVAMGHDMLPSFVFLFWFDKIL